MARVNLGKVVGPKGDPGTTNYNDLTNKPKINGKELVGDITIEGGSGELPPLDFLPAKANTDGTYVVDASLVTFKGNVVSEKEITAYKSGTGGSGGGGSTEGGTTDYNALTNKPALNGTELTSTSKLKTVNGQSLIGEGDITIESGGGSGGIGIKGTGKYSEIFNDYLNSMAEGLYAHAEGYDTYAFGDATHVEGSETAAYGHVSHAEGLGSIAHGGHSHAEGEQTKTIASCSHSEGKETQSSGQNSHAEGFRTGSLGLHSHAEGLNTFSFGICSHAEGEGHYDDSGYHSVEIQEIQILSITDKTIIVEGDFTYQQEDRYGWCFSKDRLIKVICPTYNNFSKITNARTINVSPDKFNTEVTLSDSAGTLGLKVGKNQISIIDGGIAFGEASHVEGYMNRAHAEGSHAEGGATEAKGTYSHSEGRMTEAIGDFSHAEGSDSRANGTCSHAEGSGSHAEGSDSHAEGYNTETNNEAEHAEGKYNKSNPIVKNEAGEKIKSGTISSIGIGGYTRSGILIRENAFEVLDNGEVYINGIGGYKGTNPNETNSIQKWAEKFNGISDYNDYNNLLNKPTINGKELIGDITIESGGGSGGIGKPGTGLNSEVFNNYEENVSSGECSHAEGSGVYAEGNYSHAEGFLTEAIGGSSHSEGMYTHAKGSCSHSEGSDSRANGDFSHAEGNSTWADGVSSHAEGTYTKTTNASEHAEGTYNKSNPNTTISSIGIGTSENDRNNAFEVHKDGKVFIKGIGTYDGTNPNETNSIQAIIADLQNQINALKGV